MRLAIAVIIVFLFAPHKANAVPPPDFIFNVGAQVVQIFTFVLVFLSASTSVLLRVLRRFQPNYVVGTIFLVFAISGAAAYAYSQYKQSASYRLWLSRSAAVMQQTAAPAETPASNLDKLKFDEAPNAPRSASRFSSNIAREDTDTSIRFIEEYYQKIADRDLAEAYALSKKSVSLETFQSWYRNVTGLTLDKFSHIDSHRSSLELTLYEGQTTTRYGVLMTLVFEDGVPVRVEDSEVRVLGVTTPTPESPTSLTISNEEFREGGFFVLDARENIEYAYGRYPGSTHIRFADLTAGRWIELPVDQTVAVICWSGIRGREVAEFLRTKGIRAVALADGGSGWVAEGGEWDGEIQFSARYPDEHYHLVLSTDEVTQKIKDGAFIVDSREPWKYEQSHIPGSVNLPIIYTTTALLETAFARVPPGRDVITVCDEWVNCFDAKITGVELESRRHRFLGRYITPWEFSE